MGRSMMEAGATLLGVALAWLLVPGALGPHHLLVGALVLLAVGWTWRWCAWHRRVQRATEALKTWGEGGGGDALLTGHVHVANAGFQGPPQHRHTVEPYLEHGQKGFLVRGPKAPHTGIVYPTKQEADKMAARWDDDLNAAG